MQPLFCWLALTEDFGIDIEQERERLVFVGDSPNDQPMFAYFREHDAVDAG